MRKAGVYNHGELSGILSLNDEGIYNFAYFKSYHGPPISLTMPIRSEHYVYYNFPSFFDGLLPEGNQLEALLKVAKLDRYDLFGQLVTVGQDLVGSVTVKEVRDE